MTFAVMAFLIGGLTFNASAQDAKGKTKSKAKVEKTQTEENYDQMLKDYEANVNKYIEAYEKALKGGDKTAEKNGTEYKTYLKKAQELEAKLEKAKDKLNRTQVEKFVKIKEKLAAALTKK